MASHGREDSNEDIYEDANLLEVVYEKIKIFPILVNDEQPNPEVVKAQIPEESAQISDGHRKARSNKIIRRRSQKKCYQCKICLQTFPLLRYFRKHLAVPNADKPLNKCLEYYRTTNPDRSDDAGIYIAQPNLRDKVTVTNSQTRNQSLTEEEIWLSSDDEPDMLMFQPDEELLQDKNIEVVPIIFDQNNQDLSLSDDRQTGLIEVPKADVETSLQNFKANLKVEVQTKMDNKSDICRDNFANMRLLKKHKLSAHGQPCPKCSICQLEFPTSTLLRRHKFNDHTNNTKEVQNIVNQNPSNGLRTLEEAKSHDDLGLKEHYTCNICPKWFYKRYELKQHMVNAHEQSRLECDICQGMYWTKQDLQTHRQVSHNEFRHKCDSCEEEFTSPDTLQQHKLTTHDDLPIIEDMANAINMDDEAQEKDVIQASNKVNLLCTLQEEKRPENFGLTCSICEAKFTTWNCFQRHLVSVHQQKGYECNTCQKRFVRIYDLKRHELDFHKKIRYKCDICSKSYTSDHLKRHKLNIHGEYFFKCGKCLANFTEMEDLKRHKSAVHDKFRVSCHFCNKDFCTPQYLQKHKQTQHNYIAETFDLYKHGHFLRRQTLKRH